MLSKHRGLLILILMLGSWAAGALPAAAQDTTAVPGDTAAVAAPYGRENQLDLNRASLDELKSLPIPERVAESIYRFRTYRAYFESLYDLLEVEGMTPELLDRIRPMVLITPSFELQEEEMREEEQRAQERYYVVQRFLSEEGASEGLVDEYIDRLKFPVDINRLSYYDLVSFQNVSPVDAVAVIHERSQSGKIENQRQLRSSDGLTYWGYRNLRDFIRYDEPSGENKRVTGYYQFRIYNTPYLLDNADVLNENIVGSTSSLSAQQKLNFRDYDLNTWGGRLGINRGAKPYLTNKLFLRYGSNWRGGAITHRNMGETHWDETSKYFVELQDLRPVATPFGRFQLHRAVLGNYNATFGQGLVMDATDFYMPRQTGYGYSQRSIGVHGDLSRSDEYTLKGGALEASLGRVRGTFLYSKDKKDAILNPDHSFNSYFASVPRLSNDVLQQVKEDIASGMFAGLGDTSAFQPMRDVMEERVTGENLKFEFRPGTYVGLTGLQMKYHNLAFDTPGADRWNPDPLTIVIDQGRLEDRDSEIGARYNSEDLGNYRRIWGADAQTVFSNVSLAAEYGKLETSDDPSAAKRVLSAGPEAFVANAYVQYENFNVMALYRDYDLGYDDPYDRAFSENSKYQQTIIDGNPFRLNNPYWSDLAVDNPQPKAERGYYLSTRYQFTRLFTVTGLEYDSYTRKSDGADEQRLTLRAEYRPVFPMRFRVRHRISNRHYQRPDDIRGFDSWDTRLELRVALSNYDEVNFLYSTSNVKFADRGRLSAPPNGGDTGSNEVGNAGIPAKALQASLTHNFGDFLTATVSSEIYNGFLYNFEDNEFIVVDGRGFRNWFMVRSRLSEALSWRFKWTTDHQLAKSYVDIRNFGVNAAGDPDPNATNARLDTASYRFQLDYTF